MSRCSATGESGQINTIQRFHGIIPRLPGVNSPVLSVGAPDSPLDFNSIGAAMDAIPLFQPDLPPSDPNWHNPVEQWTTLVTMALQCRLLSVPPFPPDGNGHPLGGGQ